MPENEAGTMSGNAQKGTLASAELLAAAHAAMATADFARANIERYLQLHGGSAPPHIMKIATEATLGLTKLVRDSAELAAKTLEAFVKLHRGG